MELELLNLGFQFCQACRHSSYGFTSLLLLSLQLTKHDAMLPNYNLLFTWVHWICERPDRTVMGLCERIDPKADHGNKQTA